ncbi:MAG: hypothetical protein QOI09_2243 [Chloroflexota bacterium]|jgi:hypothetical protein|nr:hypothetical protein [Chloroflexota bacterium]
MRPKTPASFIRPIGLAAAIFLATFAGFGPSVLANDTPGNNGTVKIHEGNTEKEPGEVRNEPHVCSFHLHFYFADPEQAGSWEIQEWAPTGTKGTVVLSGTYDTLGDGQDRQPPAPDVYTLPDGHYKLFWDGDTGKHDKMKVFWVDCPAPAHTPTPAQTPTPGGSEQPIGSAPASPPVSGSETPTGSELPIAGSPSPSGGEEGIVGTPPSSPPTGEVEGIVGAPPQATPPATDAAATTPATDDGWRAVLLGLAAVTALTVLLVPSRMLGARSIRAENKRSRSR